MNISKKRLDLMLERARRTGESQGRTAERVRIARLLEERAFPNLIVEEILKENEAFSLSAMAGYFKRNYQAIPTEPAERRKAIAHMLLAEGP